MTGPVRRDSGFTLTEVLVAVAIFALISTAALGLLTTAVRSRDVHAEQLERIEAVQRARVLLRDDIGQLVMRPFRTEEGVVDGRVFSGDVSGADPLEPAQPGEPREILVLTRSGWANPGGAQPRSTLQRVAWIYDGTTLKRRAWTYPDAARDAEPTTMTVLETARDLRLEFLVGNVWRPDILVSSGGENSPAPPRGVRVRYVAPGLGEIEHVLLSPAADIAA
ncbi:type II secretion system protein GspJ [Marinicauda salina]|uniref:Type II secretion system protein J n=1 Tax=Marinicauda salina TaxID=2135793 RepID=A0A2U2BSX9_9PROT|nr:type II secretion system minor pseudopilin GspJ [Marinicauda salina]PWE17112.1 type II secretion system protein GspJ [Marinicauda salina]